MQGIKKLLKYDIIVAVFSVIIIAGDISEWVARGYVRLEDILLLCIAVGLMFAVTGLHHRSKFLVNICLFLREKSLALLKSVGELFMAFSALVILGIILWILYILLRGLYGFLKYYGNFA